MTFYLILTILLLIFTGSATDAYERCEWVDGERNNQPAILISGSCSMQEIIESQYIDRIDQNSLLISASIFSLAGSRFIIDGTMFTNVRLLSTTDIYISIIAEGGELIISDVNISSYDPITMLPDENLEDGRAYIRVDAFVGADGSLNDGFVDINNSEISYLGYDYRILRKSENFASYGLSLKVRKEQHLDIVQINGSIRNSFLHHNYRGFYSYGARDIIFDANYVQNNIDYGVDPHDDSDGFIATNNMILDNGGTGLALSRRCDNSVIANNVIARNGNNGIMIHDLSNSVQITNNTIEGNGLDGIVVHDSNQINILKNTISNNRNGIRLFAGATIANIEDNIFENNIKSEIFLLHGNRDAENDLGDYSTGTDWNANNISRHNDSRVRFVSIVSNSFTPNALIEAIGAELISFSNNYYAGNVVFNIRESDYISMDGALSEGHVAYKLRSNLEDASHYSIDAKPDSALSVLSGDQVTLLGETLLFPVSNPNFSLEFSEDGKKVIKTNDKGRNIQTGILKEIPISVSEGDVSLSSYIGRFSRDEAARIELVSTDWYTSVLSINNDRCRIVKLRIEDRYLPTLSEDTFYIQTGVGFQLDHVLEDSRGRVVMEITCIQ